MEEDTRDEGKGVCRKFAVVRASAARRGEGQHCALLDSDISARHEQASLAFPARFMLAAAINPWGYG